MKKKELEQGSARRRAEVIMKVRCGLMTVTEAAKELRVSRKTYYKWEQRGLASFIDGVLDLRPGRPEEADDPHEALKQRIIDLENEKTLLQHQITLREIKHQIELEKRRKKK